MEGACQSLGDTTPQAVAMHHRHSCASPYRTAIGRISEWTAWTWAGTDRPKALGDRRTGGGKEWSWQKTVNKSMLASPPANGRQGCALLQDAQPPYWPVSGLAEQLPSPSQVHKAMCIQWPWWKWGASWMRNPSAYRCGGSAG